MTKPVNYKIPFDRYGLVFEAYDGDKEFEWKENTIFDDILEYIRFYHGRSAIHFIFKSKNTGLEYGMRIKDFHKLLIDKKLVDGNTLKGTFKFDKKGTNYAIKAL